jgi:hypothetical protein
MLLRVPLRDSVVRLWGLKHPWSQLRISQWYSLCSPEAVSGMEAQMQAKFYLYCFVCSNNLIKPHGPVQIVRMWRGTRADPVLRCLADPEGLNNGDLLIAVCHTWFLCQNIVLNVCMPQDQLFHTYGPNLFTDNQMSLNTKMTLSKWKEIAEDSITPQERQSRQHTT